MGKPIYTKKSFVQQLILLIIVALASTSIFCDNCTASWVRFIYSAGYSFMLWFLLWFGNSFLSETLSLRYNWVHHPIQRLIIGIILTTAYTTLMVYLLILGFQFFTGSDWGEENIKNNIVMSLLITFAISLFMHARSFLINWRKMELDAEKLKNESLSSQYETLKNQVNPHFLFNSFNSLTDLIYEDQDLAAKFVKQLSNVYRYLLDQQQKGLVPLSEEVDFTDNYLFLEKIRYGDNLIIEKESMDSEEWYVPPLSIQMLIENAIKHNIISKEQPLTITIKQNENQLLVINNLQPKMRHKEPSTKIGLANLKARYEYLSDSTIQIDKTADEFIVTIPLIKISEQG